MGWGGRAVGTAIGGLLGGPFGAAVGYFVGSVIDDGNENSNTSSSSSSPVTTNSSEVKDEFYQVSTNTSIKPPENLITFVGRTGAGKSSTANALFNTLVFPVGIEHGTTITVQEKEYINGYKIVDTPGLLDNDEQYSTLVWKAAKKSKIVIYTTTGQLYRPELEFVRKLHQHQQKGNQAHTEQRHLLLYVNMQDIKEHTIPSSQRQEERTKIHHAVAEWIPAEKVIFGSASPQQDGITQPPQIEDLRQMIHQHL